MRLSHILIFYISLKFNYKVFRNATHIHIYMIAVTWNGSIRHIRTTRTEILRSACASGQPNQSLYFSHMQNGNPEISKRWKVKALISLRESALSCWHYLNAHGVRYYSHETPITESQHLLKPASALALSGQSRPSALIRNLDLFPNRHIMPKWSRTIVNATFMTYVLVLNTISLANNYQ